jgi:hypothetical protein
MQSDEIRIEIVPSQHKAGGWWAYIIQEAGGDRRTIGKAFQTNPEAWQWAQAFVTRLCISNKEP